MTMAISPSNPLITRVIRIVGFGIPSVCFNEVKIWKLRLNISPTKLISSVM